ncbi:MAG: hypothetical protein WCS03_18720 [Bacteroidota bacterium]
MKKVIISLSGILVAAFVIIMVANAQNNPQEVKKATTEMSKDCGKCPSASTCEKMKEGKVCDPAKCKEMGCDPAKCKEGKCDPATCKANCAKAEGKKCDPAACTHGVKK